MEKNKMILFRDLEDITKTLHQEHYSTGGSYKLKNLIATFFGKEHNFMDSYEEARKSTVPNALEKLIVAIRTEVETNGYNWWDFHEKSIEKPTPSRLEKYFDANPKIYELIKASIPYLLPTLAAIVLSILASVQSNKYLLIIAGLFVFIPIMKIIYGFFKK